MFGERTLEFNEFLLHLKIILILTKRISSSTSTAETLFSVYGKELAQLIAICLTQLLEHGIQTLLGTQTFLAMLIQIQENGGWVVPVDHVRDCGDLFQLVVGEKGVP